MSKIDRMEQGFSQNTQQECCSISGCYSWTKRQAKMLKKEALVLNIAIADPRTPTAAKVLALATIFYLASPIDLIPDCIPVLGQLDDLIIVPLGMYIAIKMIPKEVMDEARAQVEAGQKLPKSKLAAACVIGAWAVSACVTCYFGASYFGLT